jgi:hypothetical protein
MIMIKRISVALAVALSLLAAASAGAQAATINNFGTLSPTSVESLGRAVPAATTFTDDYLFQVAENSTGASSVVNISFSNILNFSDLSLRLFGGAVNDIDTGTGTLSVVSSMLVPFTQYTVRVAGVTSGSGGGAYSGGLVVAPVPVPAALPLMLGALAGLALIARRRTGV